MTPEALETVDSFFSRFHWSSSSKKLNIKREQSGRIQAKGIQKEVSDRPLDLEEED